MVSLSKFVVTFDSRPVTGPEAVKGLKETGIQYAQTTVRMAAPLRTGRIISTDTLEEVK